MLWFTLFFVWIWMFVRVFSDILRSRDLSGWARAMWVLAVLILPIVGVLAYVVVRGDQMAENYAGGRASRGPGRPRGVHWVGTARTRGGRRRAPGPRR